MKKLIRRLSAVAGVMLAVTAFTACGDDEDEEITEPPYFNDSTIYVKISADAPASNTFTVGTNQAWNITEKPTWCELDITEGVGEAVVDVTVNSSSKNHRSGKIIVQSADLQHKKTVIVKQNGNTLSVITGNYTGSDVTYGSFKGTDNKLYKYQHKIKVEYTINGSHLASQCGVTGSAYLGITSDGVQTATITLLTNNASSTFTYRAFAINKNTGEKIYGEEKKIVSK